MRNELDISEKFDRQDVDCYATASKDRINYFVHILAFYAFTVAYVLPFHTNFPYAKIFLPLLTLTILIQILHFRNKFKTIDLLVMCGILIVAMLNFSTFLLFKFIAPIFLILLGFRDNNNISISRKYLSFLHWYSIPFIIYQLSVHRVENDVLLTGEGAGRISLSVGDPNMSSMTMLLFFFFCYKNKFWTGILLSIVCVFLFSSRNYMLSMFVFGFVFAFEGKIHKILKHVNFPCLFLLINFFVMLLSIYWISNVEASVGYELGVGRLFSFNDLSNLRRFQANHFFLESFSNNLGLALTGFKENYLPIFNGYDFGILHNSLFELTAVLGIPLAILYFYVVLKNLHIYHHQKNNLKYLYSYLFFCLFLHSALEGPYLQLLVIILALPEYKPKGYENINHYSHV